MFCDLVLWFVSGLVLWDLVFGLVPGLVLGLNLGCFVLVWFAERERDGHVCVDYLGYIGMGGVGFHFSWRVCVCVRARDSALNRGDGIGGCFWVFLVG